VAFFGAQASIDRNKRRRKDSFAKEVLQKVGNAESCSKSVRSIGVAEVVGKDTIADQPNQAAEQNTRSDRQRRSPGRECFL